VERGGLSHVSARQIKLSVFAAMATDKINQGEFTHKVTYSPELLSFLARQVEILHEYLFKFGRICIFFIFLINFKQFHLSYPVFNIMGLFVFI